MIQVSEPLNGYLENAQPHVAALPTDAEHAAQLCDIDTTTLCFIPSPLPRETELDALVHDIARSPRHGLAS